MQKRNFLVVMTIALLLLIAAPVAFAQQGYVEDVFAVDQDVIDGTVRVTRATINGPGWVVIHADAEGAPGPVIGHAEIMDGVNASIVVPIDLEGLTETLHVMLHVDDGVIDEYEFPGPDKPVMVDDELVMATFAITGVTETTPEPTEEAEEETTTAEATPEPTEETAEEAESTPEPTEEAAEEAEATPVPTEEAAEEAEAEATPEPTEETAEEAESTPEPTEEAAAEDAVMAEDIVDTAVDAGVFEILVGAIQTAGLEDALRGEGPFTVFAPTDDAFAALPEGLLESLDTETLAQILLYHVVPNDKLMANDVSRMGSAITLEGSMLEFAVDGDNVIVNEANVVQADVDASNGVIHVIDAVMLPPAVQEAMAAAAEPEEEETPEPVQAIKGSYQESEGESVTVDMVESAGDGFVAIYADDAFQPGELLGSTAVPAGVSEDVTVELDTPLTEGGMVWAVLHGDEGEVGTFEPDVDPVALYNQSDVKIPFNVVSAAAAEPEEEETPEPVQAIKGSYQESEGESVTVDMVESAGDGFVAIYADDAFQPGELLGSTAVPASVSEDVTVELDTPLTEGGMVWAVLHGDEGEVGTFEPDVDPVALYNQSDVKIPFNVALSGVTAAAAEATPEPTEEAAEEAEAEATPEPTEEAAEEAEAEATPEPTEEAAEEAEAEATPEPTEEAAEEAEAEATPEPTEEAAEEAEAEATPEPTEEAAEEAEAEATPEPTEEAAEETEAEASLEPTEQATEEAEAEATPEPTEEAAEEAEAAMMENDIVDTAVSAGTFDILVAAVQAAGLEDALRGEGPFTVFAPTDDAFSALPEGTVEALLQDTDTLSQILLYHVVAGKLLIADLADGAEAETLQGKSIVFTVDGDPVKVNDSNIIATDVEASNGVIHVIDAVMLPPAEAAMEGETAADDQAAAEDTVMEGDGEMAQAPEELPETGGGLSGVGATLPAVLLVLGGLAALAFASRRRRA